MVSVMCSCSNASCRDRQALVVYIKWVCLLCDTLLLRRELLAYVRSLPLVINCKSLLCSHGPSRTQIWHVLFLGPSTDISMRQIFENSSHIPPAPVFQSKYPKFLQSFHIYNGFWSFHPFSYSLLSESYSNSFRVSAPECLFQVFHLQYTVGKKQSPFSF